jgi:cobalt-zinc-cadmium efflux system protein
MVDIHQHKNPQQQTPSKQANRLKIVFLLSSCYLASAVIIVLITGSLSLLSEAGYMLADVGGIALALFAINYTRKSPTPERPYGFFRMEILASLPNSVVLILLSIYILYEGFMRVFAPPVIQGFPIVVAAAVGMVVNFIGMRLLISGGKGGHSHGLHNHTNEEKEWEGKEEEHHNHHNHHHHKEEKEAEEQSLNVKADI